MIGTANLVPGEIVGPPNAPWLDSAAVRTLWNRVYPLIHAIISPVDAGSQGSPRKLSATSSTLRAGTLQTLEAASQARIQDLVPQPEMGPAHN